MQATVTKSLLLESIPRLRYGFLSNHTAGGRDALDKQEPTIATVKQVHGDKLLWASAPEKRARDADALATDIPGLAVGVYSADCTPILMAALDARGNPLSVMAVHAGWRGTALGIAAKAFLEFGKEAKRKGAIRFAAAIGPCIGFESFEVGEEVVKAFPGSEERGLAKFLRMEGEQKKYKFNLPAENRRQLNDCAAQASWTLIIDDLGLCTLKGTDKFPSYRRDREKAGRILSYLSFSNEG